MPHPAAFREVVSAQIPAVQVLAGLGWQYLTPAQALALRGHSRTQPLLTAVLADWLRTHATISARGRRYAFSDANIREAVARLADEPVHGLLPTSERIYERLALGTSLTQEIEGDRKSYSLHYIDWQHPANNVYHMAEEFAVEAVGGQLVRRPDLVLFVNGIPLAVIECKRPDRASGNEKAVAQAISQLLGYQQRDQIPQLFVYAQLLLALSVNDALYATTATPKEFWAHWREEHPDEDALTELINRPLEPDVAELVYGWRNNGAELRAHVEGGGPRLPTEQDRLLYALLRPQRLLELCYQYIVYDSGIKKIARYQQYFAIKATLNRVAHHNAAGRRDGGVIWHTTGSGKSLTMVMLAKALALHPNISNPHVVLVTDRVDLDRQLAGTFRACGKRVGQARDGKHLIRLITGQLQPGDERADVITTVINKFEQAARAGAVDASANSFVLVDESHRSQYGSMHALMQQVLPNACLIGFTGTPLTKAEKSTAHKFGDFIHKYPMRQAVADQAVVPLLYEGRIVEQSVDKDQLERWFERTTRHLADEQRADLKRRMSRSEAINATEQRIREIAFNIAEHYTANWRGTGFKGQVATASKRTGLQYLRYLRDEGIKAELVISPPDTREGHADSDGELPAVQQFWQQMLQRYGSEEKYLQGVIESFRDPDGAELLVVVDKLLTGFDEPRNVVLYIDKPLKEHTLLQAIARVNRVAEGKDFGYIIDYRGVLGELNEAMNLYDALAEYDPADIDGTFSDVAAELERLPQVHSAVWAVFDGVNTADLEAAQRHLEPEDRRQRFYETLTDYARTLRVALSSSSFYQQTESARIERYKDDLRWFHSLRQAVKLRYAEAIDYRDYEAKVRKLLDDHVRATAIATITELVNVFDAEKFDAEVARLASPVAKADTILNRMKRTIIEYVDADPALYRRFSELVEDTIAAYRQGRIDQLEYLRRAQRQLDELRAGVRSGAPSKLTAYPQASAFYGVLHEPLAAYSLSAEQIADLAIAQHEAVERSKVTDWVNNVDVQNQMKQRLDTTFLDLERATDIKIDVAQLDLLIEQIIAVAIARSRHNR